MPARPSEPPGIDAIRRALMGHSFWEDRLRAVADSRVSDISVHLAVFIEPYLQYVLDGRKTVESRFSVVRCAPFARVKPADIVLLKRTGGPVVGICEVAQVWSYELEPKSWEEIRQFADALCAQDPEFWRSRSHASYATLMRLRNVRALPSIPWKKRDRRGWVVLHGAASEDLFEGII